MSAACLENALETAKTIVAGSTYAEQLVEKLLARNYRWGVGDGN